MVRPSSSSTVKEPSLFWILITPSAPPGMRAPSLAALPAVTRTRAPTAKPDGVPSASVAAAGAASLSTPRTFAPVGADRSSEISMRPSIVKGWRQQGHGLADSAPSRCASGVRTPSATTHESIQARQ
eukprot:scaffold48063_cov28-Tisochrysis_lutea.AAC.7